MGIGVLYLQATKGNLRRRRGAYARTRPGAGPTADATESTNQVVRSTLPPDPPDPAGPRRPLLQQEVSLYAAMPLMAALYGREVIDTLHERMGGDAQLLGPANEGAAPNGAWGRLLGHWGHRDGDAAGILGGGGPEFHYDFGAFQAGLDLYRREPSDGQRDHDGIYLAIGEGSADVEHNLLGRADAWEGKVGLRIQW